MFKHILVPLDGTPMAEQALGPAVFLARKTGARVTLLHSLEHAAPSQVHGARHLTGKAEATAYLEQLVAERLQGLVVAVHVHDEQVRDVPRSIAEHVGEFSPDVIVMCAHGEGSLRDKFFGSVALRVVKPGRTPVLLIRSTDGSQTEFNGFRRFLVPDDGSEAHEPGLGLCADLARACEAEMHLVRVVETLRTLGGTQAVAGQLLPGATRVMLEMDEAEAAKHLQEHVLQLRSQGLRVTGEVRRGEPARVLGEAARASGADLLVVRTHGRTGTDAFWSGSLTPRLFSDTRLPMFLVPLAEA